MTQWQANANLLLGTWNLEPKANYVSRSKISRRARAVTACRRGNWAVAVVVQRRGGPSTTTIKDSLAHGFFNLHAPYSIYIYISSYTIGYRRAKIELRSCNWRLATMYGLVTWLMTYGLTGKWCMDRTGAKCGKARVQCHEDWRQRQIVHHCHLGCCRSRDESCDGLTWWILGLRHWVTKD